MSNNTPNEEAPPESPPVTSVDVSYPWQLAPRWAAAGMITRRGQAVWVGVRWTFHVLLWIHKLTHRMMASPLCQKMEPIHGIWVKEDFVKPIMEGEIDPLLTVRLRPKARHNGLCESEK